MSLGLFILHKTCIDKLSIMKLYDDVGLHILLLPEAAGSL